MTDRREAIGLTPCCYFTPTTGNSSVISNYLVVFDNKHSSDTFVSVVGWTNGSKPHRLKRLKQQT